MIGKHLIKKNYSESLKALDIGIKGSSDEISALLEIVKRILREEHIIKKLQKAYQSIALGKAKTMLWMKDLSDRDFYSFLESKKFKIENGFAFPAVDEAGVKKFEIN
jgi:hypothetical protein